MENRRSGLVSGATTGSCAQRLRAHLLRPPGVRWHFCGQVRATTVASRCDRGADEKCASQSSQQGPANARRATRESNQLRPLRYSINVTLDGCCHHEAGLPPDEESMRYWTTQMEGADALLFGRVTYEMMESAWRRPATGTWPDWMGEREIPFAETIDRAKKHVVSSTLSEVDWNAELVRGDLGQAVQRLKQEPGEGLFVGGVTLPLALADLGLIDEYEFLVQPVLAGHGPTLLAGLRERIQLELVDRHEFRSGAVALRFRVRGNPLLDKAEDIAEDKAEEGGTLGGIADKADDVIDQIQGTKD